MHNDKNNNILNIHNIKNHSKMINQISSHNENVHKYPPIIAESNINEDNNNKIKKKKRENIKKIW